MMHGANLPLQYWFWAASLVASHSNGMSALQLKKQLRMARRPLAKRFSTLAFGNYPWPLALDVERAFYRWSISSRETNN
jgi:hypothetical protein